MSVTYVPALERDVRRERSLVAWIDARHALLPLTSIVALLAIGLAYGGRTWLRSGGDGAARTTAININTVTDTKTLERPLALVYEHRGDGEFAARALVQFV